MELILLCPHCKISVLIKKKDINCAIFRHGIMKNNGNQMDPHTPKELCDFLAKEGLIYGCGKPFRLKHEYGHSFQEQIYTTEVCDYI
jgi:hypothetical protein